MVYGIVKQSGGYIAVESAPGQGARFDIDLPRLDDAEADGEGFAPGGEPGQGSETVLLVEDEESVRELALEILQMHGYTVLVARHGAEALELTDRHLGPIHLLVADVVMPHMSGRELAERLEIRRPGTKVLYVSGYTDDAILRHGVREAGVALLQKPFTPDALARAVREVLDRTR
jgi:CheY-like chemotaxis protein